MGWVHFLLHVFLLRFISKSPYVSGTEQQLMPRTKPPYKFQLFLDNILICLSKLFRRKMKMNEQRNGFGSKLLMIGCERARLHHICHKWHQ